MKPILIAALVAMPTLAMAQAPKPSDDCLRPSQILDFQPLPQSRLLVTDNRKHRYTVSFTNSCTIGKYSQITVRSAGRGALACALKGDTVLVSDTGSPPDRCIIKAIEAAP